MSMLKHEELSANPDSGADLLLGRGARFEGKLTFEGTMRIDAVFLGSVATDGVLLVGEAARLDAEITCGTIIVHGEVNGNIQAKSAVEIHRTAKVRGDLDTPSLVIEKGALFHGSSRMEPAKKTAAVAPVVTDGTAPQQEVNGKTGAARPPPPMERPGAAAKGGKPLTP